MSWSPLWLSFQIAVLATVLAVVAGTVFALLLEWRRLPARDLVDAVISAPLVLPPTVLGYYILVAVGAGTPIGEAWEAVFGSQLVFSFAGAVIAAAVGSLPLVVRAVRVALEAIDPNLIAAARTLGARPSRVMFTVVLPLAGPGIIAGAMMGFARALGDYGATMMVVGSRIDGTPTASIFVMDQLTAGNDDRVFTMSLATTICGIVMLYFANRLTRRLHLR